MSTIFKMEPCLVLLIFITFQLCVCIYVCIGVFAGEMQVPIGGLRSPNMGARNFSPLQEQFMLLAAELSLLP